MTTFDAARLESLLRELAAVLEEQNRFARIAVVGGAAISFHWPQRQATRDIDALLYPAEAVAEACGVVAQRNGVSPDWLNDNVKLYNPDYGDPQWVVWFATEHLEVQVAPLDMLLAMKLHASRGRRDADDTHFLLDACRITSVEDAEEIYATYYPHDVLKRRAVDLVADWLASH